MATDVAIKIFTIIFLVLSGNDHSVKVSSNSEVGSGTALWEFFGFLRELVLIIHIKNSCRALPLFARGYSVLNMASTYMSVTAQGSNIRRPAL